MLLMVHFCFPAECRMRDAVSGAALLLSLLIGLSYATLQSNQYQLNYHAPNISFTLWLLCRREEKQGERRSDGMDGAQGEEHTTGRNVLIANAFQSSTLHFMSRRKIGITRFNKENDVMVSCSFSPATTPFISMNQPQRN